MKVYLDVCCLNRPFDDQTQNRVRLEAEAVLAILVRFQTGQWQWISSEVVDIEIDHTPDSERKCRVRILTTASRKSIMVSKEAEKRAQEIEKIGFHPFDALHLACAESGAVDVFLTTDDDLLRISSQHADKLAIRVENPLTWLVEVEKDESTNDD